MPIIKYVGKHIDHRGKRLYEILFKLKNFGTGRMVYRNTFKERYPEPSYYIITKVEPDFKGGNPIVSTNTVADPEFSRQRVHQVWGKNIPVRIQDFFGGGGGVAASQAYIVKLSRMSGMTP